MASQTFGTSNTTLKQLLGNGLTYRVPQYQRDYSWKQDEWDDLWEDIKTALTDIDDPAHYMGYIVLQTTDNKQFDVIDGQQRLATLSVLALATISVLLDLADEGVDTEDNRRRAEQFRATFIGYLDPVTLVPMSKLRLNRNDEGFYQDYLVPLKRLQQRRLRPSERLLQAAFEWFRRKIFESCGEKRRGEDIARFLDTLSDRLFFTTIIVNDELNAFTVFETLNARGVELSPADLLKNHLFAVVSRQRSTSDADLETLDRRWKDLADRIGSGAVKDFIRAHWISRKRPIRAAALFKEMRRDVGDRRKVFELVSQLEDDLGIYLGLSGDGGETWQPNTRDDAEILRMFNVKLPWPLLMATFRRFEENGFAQVLHACVVIAFRGIVIAGDPSNALEDQFNSVIADIRNDKLTSPAAVVHALRAAYVPDDRFKAVFADRALRTTDSRNRAIVRYILAGIERHVFGTATIDRDSKQLSIEHIYPENPGDNWADFQDPGDAATYRLGNLTLLETAMNRAVGNSPFNDKSKEYEKSGFGMTRRIASENNDWDISRMNVRQRWMAEQAAAIWRLSQFDR